MSFDLRCEILARCLGCHDPDVPVGSAILCRMQSIFVTSPNLGVYSADMRALKHLAIKNGFQVKLMKQCRGRHTLDNSSLFDRAADHVSATIDIGVNMATSQLGECADQSR